MFPLKSIMKTTKNNFESNLFLAFVQMRTTNLDTSSQKDEINFTYFYFRIKLIKM